MQNEVWKDVTDYEHAYQVSNLGNVRSKHRMVANNDKGGFRTEAAKDIKKMKSVNGYEHVKLSNNGKTKSVSVHRIVIQAFLQRIPYKQVVNHINGNRSDNRICNLEIISQSENIKHSFNVLGRIPSHLGKFGKEHNVSKPVMQFDLKGNLVNEFENAREANRIAGFNHKKISACALGKEKTHRNFIWKFKNDKRPLVLNLKRPTNWTVEMDYLLIENKASKTYMQIAVMLGVSFNAVKVRLKNELIRKAIENKKV